MIAIYTKAGDGCAPVLRFEHDATIEMAIQEVMKRYPKYVGGEHAHDVTGRIVQWFLRYRDGMMCGIGYDLLPEPSVSLTP